jgi:hypothetical protein
VDAAANPPCIQNHPSHSLAQLWFKCNEHGELLISSCFTFHMPDISTTKLRKVFNKNGVLDYITSFGYMPKSRIDPYPQSVRSPTQSVFALLLVSMTIATELWTVCVRLPCNLANFTSKWVFFDYIDQLIFLCVSCCIVMCVLLCCASNLYKIFVACGITLHLDLHVHINTYI